MKLGKKKTFFIKTFLIFLFMVFICSTTISYLYKTSNITTEEYLKLILNKIKEWVLEQSPSYPVLQIVVPDQLLFCTRLLSVSFKSFSSCTKSRESAFIFSRYVEISSEKPSLSPSSFSIAFSRAKYITGGVIQLTIHPAFLCNGPC